MHCPTQFMDVTCQPSSVTLAEHSTTRAAESLRLVQNPETKTSGRLQWVLHQGFIHAMQKSKTNLRNYKK